MHTVFRYDNTLNLAYGRFQEDLLPRPARAGETDGEFFLLCQEHRDTKHKWEKTDLKANEQASISISKLHERLSVNVLSALSDIIHQDVDRDGHLIDNQQKLYAQWRAFKDKYMPKIEDYTDPNTDTMPDPSLLLLANQVQEEHNGAVSVRANMAMLV
jgi:hypothetical protein